MSRAYETYKENIDRTRNFLSLYNDLTKELGRGRRNIPNTDVLRAGTVFLHSTLEEYLRTIVLDIKINKIDSDRKSFESALTNVSLPGDNTGRDEKKFALKTLYDYKDITVNDLIRKSIEDKTSNITFNNYHQIISALSSVGIRIERSHNAGAVIDTYIKRRHKIVHEADKNDATGSGNFKTSSISTKQLEKWINAVDGLVEEIEEKIAVNQK